MRVLVLGATGFIGNHIARRLLEGGHEVHVFHRATSNTRLLNGLNVQHHIGDLSDPFSLEAAMRPVEGVVHSAAPYPAYELGAGGEIRRALVQTRHLLDAARKTGIKRLLWTGAPPLLKPGATGQATEENHYTGPVRSAYFRMKIAEEGEFLRATREGLPGVLLKCGAVFGERDIKPSGGELLLLAAQRKLPVYAEAPLSAVDVRDIAGAHLAALTRARVGETYMLGGENTTLGPVLQAAARTAGVPPPRRISIGSLVAMAALLGTASEAAGKLLHKPEPRFPLVGIGLIRGGCHMDSSRARRDLGYTPGPMAPAVERAVRWFREEGYF